MSNRPETGVMKFGNDWSGVFIRGDHAFNYANYLEEILKHVEYEIDIHAFMVLHGLLKTLRSSNEHGHRDKKTKKDVQKMKEFLECLSNHKPSSTDESCSERNTTDEAASTVV